MENLAILAVIFFGPLFLATIVTQGTKLALHVLDK